MKIAIKIIAEEDLWTIVYYYYFFFYTRKDLWTIVLIFYTRKERLSEAFIPRPSTSK